MRGSRIILFADYYPWEAFTALASAMRRDGFAVQRVSSAPRDGWRRLMQQVDRLVYGRTRDLVVPPPAKGGEVALTDPGAVIPVGTCDIQAPDDLSRLLLTEVPGAAEIMDRARATFPAVDLFDKAAMSGVARSLGVPVPEEFPLPGPVRFPVVVKSVVGSGGDRVRVVHDDRELERAVAELGQLSDTPVTVQAYHSAGQFVVGAVAKDGHFLVVAAYATEPSAHDPNGPSSVVVTVDHPEAVAASEAIAGAIGANGFVCLDFVVGQDGTAYFIDFNPRCFGSWPALQELGVDFLGAYRHVLDAGPAPQQVVLAAGQRSALLRFPAGARTVAGVGRWAASGIGVVARRWHLLGWRWGVVSLAKIAAGSVQATAHLSRGGAHPDGG